MLLAAADSASWWLGQASLPSHPFSVSRRQKPAPAPWALRRDLLGHMDPGIWIRNSAACCRCRLRQVPGTKDGVCGWWNFKGPLGLSLSNRPDRTGYTSQPCQEQRAVPSLAKGPRNLMSDQKWDSNCRKRVQVLLLQAQSPCVF